MEIIYSRAEDIFVIINTTGKETVKKIDYGFVTVSFDIDMNPVMMEFMEASVQFRVPRDELFKFTRQR